MCDAPIYQPKCMFCNKSLSSSYEKWYWISELPKNDRCCGGKWSAICGKCWIEKKDEIKEKKKGWESYHTESKHFSGKRIWIWEGKNVSFGIYMKRKWGDNAHTKGIEKWM